MIRSPAPPQIPRRISIDVSSTVEVVRPNQNYYLTKRLLDLCVCLLVCPIVLPIIAVCAVCIWIEDPGSVFFFQRRTGKGGHLFWMWKLRTMYTDAEERKLELLDQNELTWPDFKIKDDPRITRVGRFLRKTSLDELPQIFNVFRGEMSLVGPRPTSFHADTYTLEQTERLEVAPGITGLWQVSGRSDVDFTDRVRMDVEYIEKQSFWLDVKILWMTIFAVFSRRGAS